MATRAAAAIATWKLALPITAIVLAALLFAGLFLGASGSAASGPGQVCTVKGETAHDIPTGYVPWLERAAAKYELGSRGFSVVAAVHKVETDFARSDLPGVRSGENPSGAGGPGQFLAPTWDAYGVDANGDGSADRYSIPDSAFATANYLRASGAPADWRGALFAYNHADWYVNQVLDQAEAFQGRLVCSLVPARGSPIELGRIDWTDTSGPWAGSRKFADLARQLAARHGCEVVSAKRATQSTASGGVSDHWAGATHSFAYDLAGCSLIFPGGAADDSAREIAAAFDLPTHSGTVSAYRGRYRVQLLWQTSTGGNHFNHIHIGIRNLCCPRG